MSEESNTDALRISRDSIRDLVKSVLAVTKPQAVEGGDAGAERAIWMISSLSSLTLPGRISFMASR